MVPKGYYAFLFKRSGSQDVSVRFPDHPNIVTSGHDWKHAEEMALEALTGCLEVGLDADCPLPVASEKPDVAQRKRLIFVPLAASLRVSYILRDSRKQAGLSYKAVAAHLGISVRRYKRLEQSNCTTHTILMLEQIAKLYGKELIVELV